MFPVLRSAKMCWFLEKLWEIHSQETVRKPFLENMFNVYLTMSTACSQIRHHQIISNVIQDHFLIPRPNVVTSGPMTILYQTCVRVSGYLKQDVGKVFLFFEGRKDHYRSVLLPWLKKKKILSHLIILWHWIISLFHDTKFSCYIVILNYHIMMWSWINH